MWNDDLDDDDDGDDDALLCSVVFTKIVSQIMFKFAFTQPCLIKPYGRYLRHGGGSVGILGRKLG